MSKKNRSWSHANTKEIKKINAYLILNHLSLMMIKFKLIF